MGYMLLEETDKPDAEFWVSKDNLTDSFCWLWKNTQPTWRESTNSWEGDPLHLNAEDRATFELLGLLPEPGKCLHVKRYGRRLEVVEVKSASGESHKESPLETTEKDLNKPSEME